MRGLRCPRRLQIQIQAQCCPRPTSTIEQRTVKPQPGSILILIHTLLPRPSQPPQPSTVVQPNTAPHQYCNHHHQPHQKSWRHYEHQQRGLNSGPGLRFRLLLSAICSACHNHADPARCLPFPLPLPLLRLLLIADRRLLPQSSRRAPSRAPTLVAHVPPVAVRWPSPPSLAAAAAAAWGLPNAPTSAAPSTATRGELCSARSSPLCSRRTHIGFAVRLSHTGRGTAARPVPPVSPQRPGATTSHCATRLAHL